MEVETAREESIRRDPAAMDTGSRRTVVVALLANVGVAIAKVVGFFFTGSSALAAEAAHSFADTGNELLLVFGGHRSRRPADEEHPFGYAGEIYFWGFVIALVLFVVGAIFALVVGIMKFEHPHAIEAPAVAVGILLLAMVFEGLSLRTARREANRRRHGAPWSQFVHRAKSPQLLVVLVEDSGALVGLAVALAGTLLTVGTGDGRFDAAASVAIAVLLAVMASVLGLEMQSLLVGESAAPEVIDEIRATIVESDDVAGITDLRTLQLGPRDVLVAGRVVLRDLRHLGAANGPPAALARIEGRVRRRVPLASHVYLVPDAP
jgi:cation diffusion facilitator family transporter